MRRKIQIAAADGLTQIPDAPTSHVGPQVVADDPANDLTRARLMAAAMDLVAQHGIRGTTVRELAQAAGSNIAAVNYHYGSKQDLMSEAIIRIMLPVNRRRMEMLTAAARDPDSGAMDVRDILSCLFRPVLESPVGADGVRRYLRVLYHYRAEASAQANALIRDTFDEAGRLFVDELVRALPHLSRAEVIWRYELARGGILHTLTTGDPRYLRRRKLDKGALLMELDNVEPIMELFLGCYLPMMQGPRIWSDDQLVAASPQP
ncbi:MAG: TetR family transcriptional regulator [Gemmobacter sp.]|nr:TetR family transcriptional regulator [Gemmobacter sp.]